jgi:hypothetical protein
MAVIQDPFEPLRELVDRLLAGVFTSVVGKVTALGI